MCDNDFVWPSSDESFFDNDARFKWDATYWNREPHLAQSFKEAGDSILRAFVESRGRYRYLVFPVLYCYRHHFELMIKYIIAGVQKYHDLSERNTSGHKLNQLWKTMENTISEAMADLMFPNEDEKTTFQRVKKRIMELSEHDPRGESFRYSKTSKGVEINDAVEISPSTLHRTVEESSVYLLALYDYCTNGEG